MHKNVPINAPNVPSYDFFEPGHLCLPKLTPTIDAAASPIARTLKPEICTINNDGVLRSDKRIGRPKPKSKYRCVKTNSPLSRSSIKPET